MEPHPFLVANVLQRGSYVSQQSALAFHGIIPEHVPVVTSVGPRRPETIRNPIPRFSEGLDFSLITSRTDPGLPSALQEVRRALRAEDYRVDVTIKERKAVASAFVKFPGLLHDLGLSPRAAHTLSVKVEVDTTPPAGAALETTIVRRHVTLRLCHHDKASLVAGKLHAILARRWAKGRDLYDLAWYLADRTWPAPNLVLLNAALAQTGWTGPIMTATNWTAEVRQRLATLAWTVAQADVRPFLEHDRDLQLVSWDALQGLLNASSAQSMIR